MWRRTVAVFRSNNSNKRAPFVPEQGRASTSKKALVVGSSGVLGRAIVQQLQEVHDMTVLQADVVAVTPMSSSSSKIKGGGAFCDLSQSSSLSDLTVHLSNAVGNFLNAPNETLDVVVCAAGGWAGNPPMPSQQPNTTITTTTTNDDPIKMMIAAHAVAYAETMDRMRQVNLDPVVATSFFIPHYLSRDSLFVAIGATAALQPTPDMVAYGMAKAATHFCLQTLGAGTNQSLDPKTVRDRSTLITPVTVVGLLPTILDTPGNRETMTYSVHWTPPLAIAKQIGEWVQSPALRPHSGALLKVYTNHKGETSFSIVR